MTFTQSVRKCLGPGYLFVVRGRASRSEFWWFMLFIFLVNLAGGMLFSLFPPMLGASLSLVLSLLLLPPNLGVTVRRLHDRNLRGWWLLLPLGALAFWGLSGGVMSPVNNILNFSMSLCYLIILCLPGQPGANRFGPEPADSMKNA